MTTHDVRALVARWRALLESEKIRRRRAAVVDHVIHSMAMEGEPVSDRWIEQARQRQRVVLGSHRSCTHGSAQQRRPAGEPAEPVDTGNTPSSRRLSGPKPITRSPI
ncbi:hypothetical protein [Rhodococcus sp. YH1]|uniref:hypothetical protein n=1 Tax=Rhodococcus sp. YH1 TaxID=89066 RepID=UPI001EE41EA8